MLILSYPKLYVVTVDNDVAKTLLFHFGNDHITQGFTTPSLGSTDISNMHRARCSG